MPSSGVQTCARSEEHTSELQSHDNLVCRLLLEKKKKTKHHNIQDRHRSSILLNTTHSPHTILEGRHFVQMMFIMLLPLFVFFYFFFFLNNAAPPKISPFPLPPALPI